MLRFFLVLLLGWLPLSYGFTVLIMGDSLSSGFGIQPQSHWSVLIQPYAHDVRWVNVSEAGLTTSGALLRLPRVLKRYQPNLTVIALGGNDGLRGLPVQGIQARLSHMIIHAKAYGDVLLVGVRLPPNYGQDYVSSFVRMFDTLAKNHHLPTPPFILRHVGEYPSLMQSDGIHPNAKAQPVIMKNIWQSLGPMLQQRGVMIQQSVHQDESP